MSVRVGPSGTGEGPPGSRRVRVPVRRIPAWLEGFGRRHGAFSTAAMPAGAGWRLLAADGAEALIGAPEWPGAPAPTVLAVPAALAELAPGYGILLLRRAGYAAARVRGAVVVESKVSSRHIHGRTAAGGWSQQRYARRRANQADEITSAAAQAAVRIMIGAADGPGFLVTGGDRALLAAAREEMPPELASLPVVHLGVGTPTAAVLAGVPDLVLAVDVVVHQPGGEGQG